MAAKETFFVQSIPSILMSNKNLSFRPLAHVSGPTSNKLVVVVVVVVVGNVHTFKYGVIWK